MFEITIKEIKTVRQMVRGRYDVIEKRPFTDKELSEANDQWRTSKISATAIKEVMGYQPDHEENVKFEYEVLKQVVEDLDLPGVIKAINKL